MNVRELRKQANFKSVEQQNTLDKLHIVNTQIDMMAWYEADGRNFIGAIIRILIIVLVSCVNILINNIFIGFKEAYALLLLLIILIALIGIALLHGVRDDVYKALKSEYERMDIACFLNNRNSSKEK